MTVTLIPALIDKQDSREIVRDKIAEILVLNRDNQVLLAIAAGKTDPQEWYFEVYTERAFPWEQFQNDDDNVTPIVNVWFETDSVETGASDPINRQQTTGKFNIDVYGRGLNRDDSVDASAQVPGDLDAALNMSRTMRMVRNIIMAEQNIYLDLQPLVSQRMPDSIQTFQPQLDDQNVIPIMASRLRLSVRYNEFSPTNALEILEKIQITTTLSPSGEVIVSEYDYPL